MHRLSFALLFFASISFVVPDLAYGTEYFSRVTTGTVAGTTWSTTRGGTATAVTISAANTFVIQSGHSITLSANATTGLITVESGGFLILNGNRQLTGPLIINSGGQLTLTTRVLTMVGDWTNNGTISVSTGGITYSTYTGINNGAYTCSSTGSIVKTTGSLTNGPSGTITIVGAGTVTMGTGNFVNNNPQATNPMGGVNFGSSAVTITGTAVGQTIGSFTTTGLFSCTKASGDMTLSGNISASGLTKSGNGTLNMGSGTHTFSTAVITLTAGVMNGGSSTINVNFVSTAVWAGTASVFVPQTSTVNFGAAGAQTITATGTEAFYNLSYSNSGTKTNATYSVAGTFTLQGAATASANPTYTGSLYGLKYATSTNRNAGTEWPSPFDGSAGVTIETTGGTSITVSGAKTFSLDDPLIITSGTLTSGANAFTFGGDFVKNGGTWTTTGDVTINEARVAQSIGTFSTTGLVTFAKPSGTATLAGAVTGGAFTMNGAGTLNLGAGFTHDFSGTWTNTDGTLEGNTSTLNMAGTSSGTGVTFTPNASTVNFDGSGAQLIPAFNYFNLQTSTGNTKTLTGSTTVGGVLTINASNTLSLSDKTLTLTGTGTPFVRTGTFDPSTGTIIYTGATSNVTATTYTNLQTSGDQTLAGGITVTGALAINSGTLFAGANTITLSGTGTPFVSSGTFNAGTGNVLYSNATATIAPLTYYNLQIQTAGTKTLGGNTTVTRVLTISSGTLSLSDKILTLSYANTAPLVNSGTFSPSTGKVIYSGATQTVIAVPYFDLQIETAGVKTLGGSITVSGVLTIQSGSTFTMGTSQVLTLSGSGTPFVNNSGTFNRGTSTVLYSNASATLAPLTYYNLQTSTAGTKTLGGNTTVANVLTINSGTFDTGAFTLTLSGTGTPLVDNGTFTASAGSTVLYNNATANIAAEIYANLQTSTTGTKTLSGNTEVKEVLTINSGTFATGAFILTLSGTGTPLVNNGTFTASASSTVIYSGATATITGATYVNLQTSTAGTKTLGANTTVSGILTINSGTLDLSNRTLTLSGSGIPLVNGGTFTPSTSTVIYSAAAVTIAAVNYFNLTGSAGGTKILPAGTIGVAGTFNPAGGTYSVDNANIVNFNGAGPTQTIPTFTFKKMILSGSGQKIIATTVSVAQVDIETGPTMDITTGQLDVQ